MKNILIYSFLPIVLIIFFVLPRFISVSPFTLLLSTILLTIIFAVNDGS